MGSVIEANGVPVYKVDDLGRVFNLDGTPARTILDK